MLVDEQAIQDLEFHTIREVLAGYCVQPTAKGRMLLLAPVKDFGDLKSELQCAEEFAHIRRENISFPALDFDELTDEIKLLQLRDSVLSEDSFYRLHRANTLVNEIIKAFEGVEEVFTALHALIAETEHSEEMMKAITHVFDTKWKVKDDASPELKQIREATANVRRNIAKNFSRVMKEYQAKGFLGDTGEAYLNNRKVLAVYSTHKRKIPGLVVSSSKTGALTYIEPEINIQLNFELESLLDDERTEIRRILLQLTNSIRHKLPVIREFHRILTEFDFIHAKTKLALELDATLPEIEHDPVVHLVKAFHPLLLINNKKLGRKTFPQTLTMDAGSRMLVITGPNAGGKSITLKTVGLLQVMLQSGLLVPVALGSRMSFFASILTDIGDNQSIENQLSTYSYRLKRMKLFLEVANKRSLVLLDEFGTGSDPDLGGALAEVFFEELYKKKSFGVITTHYSNIKIKAAELPHALNACMLFNTKTLEPTYQLSLGQPGSSFTFEVAEINGIDKKLIEAAKKKLSKQKVQMDGMLAALQEEKTQLEAEREHAQTAAVFASNTILDFEKKKDKYEERLEKQQDTMERNNKYLSHGKRLAGFVESYNLRSKNKELLDDVKKYIAMEKTKLDDERKQRSVEKKLSQEKEHTEKKQKKKEAIKIGSLVRLQNTKQTGTVIEIEKGQAIVAIGVFKTKVDMEKLEWIR
ncbi:MAG: endonuclease MutS2 [Flavobacteriales bacterium]